MIQWEYCEIVETINDADDTRRVTLIYMDGPSQTADSVPEIFVMLCDDGWEFLNKKSFTWQMWKGNKWGLPIESTNKYLFRRISNP